MNTSFFHHTPHPHIPQNINNVHAKERQGINDKIAVTITKAFGSMPAFYTLVLWMLIWMALASGGVWIFAADHYPFSFLLFLSNLIQLWALPILAVGQSVLSRKQELQADEQFATTTKSFTDIEQIMQHLNAQDQHILEQEKLLQSILENMQSQKM